MPGHLRGQVDLRGGVVKVLAGLIRQRGAPAFIRSDNGSEFTARVVARWLTDAHIVAGYIEPGTSVAEWFYRELQQPLLG